MSHLNGKGPDDRGNKTGRGLGNCKGNSVPADTGKLGKGMGLRRKSGGGQGSGKRLKSGLSEISR